MAENSEAVNSIENFTKIENHIRLVGVLMRQAAASVEPGIMLELTEELDGLVTGLLTGWKTSIERNMGVISRLETRIHELEQYEPRSV